MAHEDRRNDVILETRNLSKVFDGLRAVSNVSCQIKKGELMSIIGPNGAGKTTLFNLLSGHLIASEGQIFFKGQEITRMSDYERCRLGIGRSFQITNIFPGLTTFENLRVAVQSRFTTYGLWKSWTGYKNINEKAKAILDLIGLYDKRNLIASALAYGEQRYLEIGITIATDPVLLLLDEPTSGMSPEESQETAEFIRRLSQDLDVVLVEHDMKVVMAISDKVTCLADGCVIACDTPQRIRENPDVQECYFGG